MKHTLCSFFLLILLMCLQACTEQNGQTPIINEGETATLILDGLQFTEGPVWHQDGYLLFSDIPANTIYTWTPGRDEPEVFRNPSGNANGNAFNAEGMLISAEHGNRRVSKTEADGNTITLADRFEGKRLNSPNDLAIASGGRIYFTDPPYGISEDQEELDFYGVYMIDTDGSLRLLDDSFIRPNGIALSPDESRLYVNDSQDKFIRVYDVNADGSITNGRLFADLSSSPLSGTTDGMKVDTLGNVFSSGPGGVWVFSAEGEELHFVPVPENTTNVTFGGEDYSTLYVTASSSVYKIETNTAGIRP